MSMRRLWVFSLAAFVGVVTAAETLPECAETVPGAEEPFGLEALPDPRPVLSVRANGYGSALTAVTGGGENVRAALDRRAIEGRVFSAETREPLESFEVAAHPIAQDSLPASWPEWMVTFDFQGFSCADGRYRIEDLPTFNLVVVARAEGYAPGHLILTGSSGQKTLRGVDLYLDRGGATVEGVVRNEDGEPVPNAELKWAGPGFEMGARARARRIPAGTSGEDGFFKLESLPPGDYTLIAEHPEYTPGQAEFGAESNGFVELELVLGTGAAILGTVSKYGEPVEGARVNVLGPALIHSGGVSTCAGGAYRISGLRPGDATVIVSHERGAPPLRRSVEIASGEEVTVNFDIDDRASLEGRITVGGAVPARGEAVMWIPADGDRPPVDRTVEIAEDGRYEFDRLPGGARGTLRIQTWTAPTFGDGWGGMTDFVDVTLGPDGVTRRDVDLEARGAMLFGEVRGLRRGQSAVVVVLPSDQYGAFVNRQDLETAYQQGHVVGETWMRASFAREYSISGLPPGTYVVAAYTGTAPLSIPEDGRRLPTLQITIAENEPLRVLNIEIPDLAEG